MSVAGPAFLATTSHGTRLGNAVVVADFNGDGFLDLAGVIGSNGSYQFRVALNDGNW